MIRKQKIMLISAFVVLASAIGMAAPSPAFAADTSCGDVKTSIIGGDICNGTNSNSTGSKSPIWSILLLVLNILTGGVGIAAVGGIVYAAILYSSAGASQEQTKKAISIITNVVIGVVAYALMYLFLNFLIPGGIFS